MFFMCRVLHFLKIYVSTCPCHLTCLYPCPYFLTDTSKLPLGGLFIFENYVCTSDTSFCYVILHSINMWKALN